MSLDVLLRPLRTRIANMLGRAVSLLVDDSGGLQVHQLGVLAGETRSGCERVQQYGLTSHPHPGAEAVVLFVGGRRDHGLVVAVDDRRHRLRGLEQGEVALYTDEGDRIVLQRGRVIEVVAGAKVRVDAPLVEVTGDVTIAGNATIAGTLQVAGLVTAEASVAVTGNVGATGAISDGGGSMASMRTAYNGHTHSAPGGGTTGGPSLGM